MDETEDPPPPKPIDDFRGEYRWLSNFHVAPVRLNFPACDETVYRDVPGWSFPDLVSGARDYPSVEHAYQAAKTLDLGEREMIRRAPLPRDAKRLGRSVTMRTDWERDTVLERWLLAGFNTWQIRRAPFKVLVMSELLAQKFPVNLDHELTEKLLATYPRDLVEGNSWGDRFWGVCGGVGENWLGKLLVRQRDHVIQKLREHARNNGEKHYECDCFGCRCRKRLHKIYVSAQAR